MGYPPERPKPLPQTAYLLYALDFPHDHARSRAYRWGEDGIAGVCDTHGFQNVAFAFWNEEEYGPMALCMRWSAAH